MRNLYSLFFLFIFLSKSQTLFGMIAQDSPKISSVFLSFDFGLHYEQQSSGDEDDFRHMKLTAQIPILAQGFTTGASLGYLYDASPEQTRNLRVERSIWEITSLSTLSYPLYFWWRLNAEIGLEKRDLQIEFKSLKR